HSQERLSITLLSCPISKEIIGSHQFVLNGNIGTVSGSPVVGEHDHCFFRIIRRRWIPGALTIVTRIRSGSSPAIQEGDCSLSQVLQFHQLIFNQKFIVGVYNYLKDVLILNNGRRYVLILHWRQLTAYPAVALHGSSHQKEDQKQEGNVC